MLIKHCNIILMYFNLLHLCFPIDATILLEIELIKIVDCSGIDRSNEISGENNSFSEIYSKAKGYQILGNDFFGQGNISAAIDKY